MQRSCWEGALYRQQPQKDSKSRQSPGQEKKKTYGARLLLRSLAANSEKKTGFKPSNLKVISESSIRDEKNERVGRRPQQRKSDKWISLGTVGALSCQ